MEQLQVVEAVYFDQVNEAAASYATDRAAEMVGMKWVDGELVTNPNAEWVITETTRTEIRALVQKAFEEGMAPRDLSIAIRDDVMFSRQRADMIARTELAKSQVKGALNSWKESGRVSGKYWILGSEHDVDDVCDMNVAAGTIPLGDDFPSGDPGAPAHPNCACDIIAVLKSAVETEAAAA